MTLNADAAAMRAACATQLYDEWHGYYILQRLDGGAYVDVRRLIREEALIYRTASNEVLELKWLQ